MKALAKLAASAWKDLLALKSGDKSQPSMQATIFWMLIYNAAGKTTILYKLKLGEIVTTIPTIGEPPLQASWISLRALHVSLRKLNPLTAKAVI